MNKILPPKILPVVSKARFGDYRPYGTFGEYYNARLDYLDSVNQYEEWASEHPVAWTYHKFFQVLIYFGLPIGLMVFIIDKLS